MKIIINGQEVIVPGKRKIAYEDIVAIVYRPSITFGKGHKSNPNGMLSRGDSVRLTEGMVFNCVMTGAA